MYDTSHLSNNTASVLLLLLLFSLSNTVGSLAAVDLSQHTLELLQKPRHFLLCSYRHAKTSQATHFLASEPRNDTPRLRQSLLHLKSHLIAGLALRAVEHLDEEEVRFAAAQETSDPGDLGHLRQHALPLLEDGSTVVVHDLEVLRQ